MKAVQFSNVALLLLVSLGLGGLSPVQAQSNNPPVANAGPDQTVYEFNNVILDGTNSYDPDDDPITYSWTQIAGTFVTLLNPTTVHPSFTAPQQPPTGHETLTFSLTVTDSFGATSSDSVDVTVRDIYVPPDCSSAQPSIPTLWPPNHKFQLVRIVGVNEHDPEITVVTAVTGTYQDEPVAGTEDGDTAPDAVIQPDGSVLLRAERANRGNGRVYHVFFTADDGYGGSCSGAVTVCAPITRNGSCIDEGPLYDSTRQ